MIQQKIYPVKEIIPSKVDRDHRRASGISRLICLCVVLGKPTISAASTQSVSPAWPVPDPDVLSSSSSPTVLILPENGKPSYTVGGSLLPSQYDTDNPISSISNAPTLFPTVEPSRNPSHYPSVLQSVTNSFASDTPTQGPSHLPSTEPTIALYSMPSIPHSVNPAKLYSQSSAPTWKSTNAPSVSPSSTGTFSAPSRAIFSQAPLWQDSRSTQTPLSIRAHSSSPLSHSTTSPIAFLSSGPTTEPSLYTKSSLTPSWDNSSFPSFGPTGQFSSTPSTTLSELPTTTPSTQPSMPPSVSLKISTIEVTMDLEGTDILVGRSIITWESITSEHIRSTIAGRHSRSQISDLRTRTNIKQMDRPNPPPTRRTRLLQHSPLKIVFDADFEYRSPGGYNVSTWAGQAFKSADNRWAYVRKLQRTGDRAFASVTNVKVTINGAIQTQSNSGSLTQRKQEDSSLDIFLIGGIGIGCLAVIVPTYTSTLDEGPQRINTDVIVRNQEDVSTLGEPTCIGGAMMYNVPLDDDDEANPTVVSGDYDFAKHFGMPAGVAPSSVSGSSKYLTQSIGSSGRDLTTLGETSFASGTHRTNCSDNDSFELQFQEELEEYEVIAPSGKLGMVIDTPLGSSPIVHAIKDSSSLAEKVSVGDCLLVVDGIDTSGMTAMEVSTLISKRAEKQSRRLVFAKARVRSNSIKTN